MDGVRAVVEGNNRTRITVETVGKTVSFTLGQLTRERYLRWPVGAGQVCGVFHDRRRAVLHGTGTQTVAVQDLHRIVRRITVDNRSRTAVAGDRQTDVLTTRGHFGACTRLELTSELA